MEQFAGLGAKILLRVRKGGRMIVNLSSANLISMPTALETLGFFLLCTYDAGISSLHLVHFQF